MRDKRVKQSFAEWCKSNNQLNILNLWDYDKNMLTPDEVGSSSSKQQFYLKCPNDKHESILYKAANITRHGHFICKRCNSIGQFLIDKYGETAIQDYWSEKNEQDPFSYDLHSRSHIWIKCQIKLYHDDYQTTCDRFVQGCRCPWCASKKIHPLDSFAQYNIDRLGEDFLKRYWCSDNTLDPWSISPFKNGVKVKIQCQHVSYHQFWVSANAFSTGIDCPFCNKKRLHPLDSLGHQYPEIIAKWSDKNKKSPFEFRIMSHQKIWLKCENKLHEDYEQRVVDYTRWSGLCPTCQRLKRESDLEEAVRLYLESKYDNILHERDCTLCPRNILTGYLLYYDNEIPDLNLIIEVHGKQHYEPTGFHKMAIRHNNRTLAEEFRYSQWKDQYKKDYALAHGYRYLEIPYYTIPTNEYKILIDTQISNILSIKNRNDCSGNNSNIITEVIPPVDTDEGNIQSELVL